jgi:hypothetical protein
MPASIVINQLRDPIQLSGTITAPYDFIKGKLSKYKPENAHLIYDNRSRHLTLILNDDSLINDEVSGNLIFSEVFNEFGINRGKKFTKDSLFLLLRKYRFCFNNVQHQMDLIANLNKYNATIKKVIQDEKNTNGSIKKSVEFLVEQGHEFNAEINLNIPIFVGLEPSFINVELCIDATDGELKFYFLSDELFEVEKNIVENAVRDQVNKIVKIFNCATIEKY